MLSGLNLKQEPSFLLLISSCILTIITNGSNGKAANFSKHTSPSLCFIFIRHLQAVHSVLWVLHLIDDGLLSVQIFLAHKNHRIYHNIRFPFRFVFIFILHRGWVSGFIVHLASPLALKIADWFDFIVIRLLLGVSTAIAYEEFTTRFSASFTTGELCMVIQGLFSFIGISLVSTKSVVFDGERYDITLHTQVIHFLSQKLFQLAVIIKLASLIDLTSSVIFPMALVSLLGGAYYFFWTHLLPEEPITWLVKQAILTDTRVSFVLEKSMTIQHLIAHFRWDY